MLNQSKILDMNPQLGLLNDIYQDVNNVSRDSTLSNYIRIAVADVFLTAQDKSLYSIDIESLCNTDELKEELDPRTFNFLQALNLNGIDHALEISEDFGGVAHCLADQVNTLDAVKIDSDRCRLALTRCLEKPNICHISEDLEKLQFPQKYYDLIIIGRLESLNLSVSSQQDLLARLQKSLTDRGTIVINARNLNRISKWMDSSDDSSTGSIPFQDLYHNNPKLEIGKAQLCEMMANAEFKEVDLHATFSSGSRCQNLFSEHYLDSCSHALNHFYQLGSIRAEKVSEYLLFNRMITDNTNIFDLASRFVAIGGSDSTHTKKIYNYDFAHFSGIGRKPKWRTFTRRVRADTAVLKSLLYPRFGRAEPADEEISSAQILPMVKQNLDPQPFHQGRLLIDDWLHALSKKNYASLQALIVEYNEWLIDRGLQVDLASCSYDLLPFNIIISENEASRSYLTIDTEWQITGEISSEFVLFRALFWFAFQNKPLFQGLAKQYGLATIGTFVVLNMPGISQLSELRKFVELEEQIQSQIENNFHAKSVEHALLQSFDSESVAEETIYKCQIAWADNSGNTDQENSIYQSWEPAAGAQTVKIPLPEFNVEKSILRVDPFTGKSLFGFSSITLLDANAIPLWKLESMSAINQFAKVINAKTVTAENGIEFFSTLNNDPHFLFDLSQVPNIAKACFAVMTLDVLYDVTFSAALNTVSDALKEQEVSLISMSNVVNQSQAEQRFLNVRLDDLIEHRTQLISNKKDHISQLEERVFQLSAQNDQLFSLLKATSSQRIKALILRLIGRAPKDG